MVDLYDLFRPTRFSDVIGHSDIVSFLMQSIVKAIIPNFMVFYGAYGSGKTTLARIYAKAVNCEDGVIASRPCGFCETCVNSDSYLFEYNASHYTKIDDIRSLFGCMASRPLYGTYKFYLLDEFNMFSNKSLHLMLKEVEEPYKHVKYIAIANSIESIIPSLLSRAMLFKFCGVGSECSHDIVNYVTTIVKNNSLKCDINRLVDHILSRCEQLPEVSCRCIINSVIKFLISDANSVGYDSDMSSNINDICFDLFLSLSSDLPGKYNIINRFYSANGSPDYLLSAAVRLIVNKVFVTDGDSTDLKKKYCEVGNLIVRNYDTAVRNKFNIALLVGAVHMILNS